MYPYSKIDVDNYTNSEGGSGTLNSWYIAYPPLSEEERIKAEKQRKKMIIAYRKFIKEKIVENENAIQLAIEHNLRKGKLKIFIAERIRLENLYKESLSWKKQL